MKGEKGKSFSVSTRVRNRSLKLTIWENERAELETIDTPDNLDEDQKKIIWRRTRDFIISKRMQ